MMDKRQGKKQSWEWLPAQMPGVAGQLADKRREVGPEWVNECWKRGVINREPGWFFAAEGALMVGVLGDDDAVLQFVRHGLQSGASVVVLRNKEVSDGTH